jgi:hypothetical protein
VQPSVNDLTGWPTLDTLPSPIEAEFPRGAWRVEAKVKLGLTMGVGYMMMLLPLMILAAFVLVGGFSIYSLVKIARARSLNPPSLSPQSAGYQERAQLDYQLSTDQISPADYETHRNRLLGLPDPEPR